MAALIAIYRENMSGFSVHVLEVIISISTVTVCAECFGNFEGPRHLRSQREKECGRGIQARRGGGRVRSGGPHAMETHLFR